jgi:hypothetical protein
MYKKNSGESSNIAKNYFHNYSELAYKPKKYDFSVIKYSISKHVNNVNPTDMYINKRNNAVKDSNDA